MSIVSILGRVTLVLILGMVATRVWPRTSAAQRHLIWSSTCCAALLVPILLWMVPQRPWHILPATTSTQVSHTPVRVASHISDATQHDGSAIVPSQSNLQESQADVGVPTLGMRVGYLLWGMGTFVVLLVLIRSWRLVNVLAKEAAPVTDPRILGLLAEIVVREQYTRPITVKSHPTAMPMVCGLLRPVIILPSSAITWDDTRLRHVLVHEVAHVVRSDAWTRTLAFVACAAYWFHPFIWFAARELRRERERACDDAVLNGGSCPADYATDLLDLTCNLTAVHGASIAALTFARASHMLERIRAIVDIKKRRTAVTRRVAAVTWGTTFSAMLPIVGTTCQPRETAVDSERLLSRGSTLQQDTVRAMVGNAHVMLIYSPPSGHFLDTDTVEQIVPLSQMFGTGAGEATTLITDKDLLIGPKWVCSVPVVNDVCPTGQANGILVLVPAGTYTLYAKQENQDAMLQKYRWNGVLIVSRQKGRLFLPYDPSQDLVRVNGMKIGYDSLFQQDGFRIELIRENTMSSGLFLKLGGMSGTVLLAEATPYNKTWIPVVHANLPLGVDLGSNR